MRHREHPFQGKFAEAIIHKRWNDFAHDAAAPELFTNKITKFGSEPVNIFTTMKSDSAHQRAVDFDAKDLLGNLLRHDTFQEAFGIFDRVWIRESIPQVDRDVAIVRVFRERLCIAQTAIADRAALEL